MRLELVSLVCNGSLQVCQDLYKPELLAGAGNTSACAVLPIQPVQPGDEKTSANGTQRLLKLHFYVRLSNSRQWILYFPCRLCESVTLQLLTSFSCSAATSHRAVHGSLTTHRVQAHVHGSHSHNDFSLQVYPTKTKQFDHPNSHSFPATRSLGKGRSITLNRLIPDEQNSICRMVFVVTNALRTLV